MAIELVKKNYSETKVTAMLIDDRSVYMTGGKSLPDEENDRVVDILNRLLPIGMPTPKRWCEQLFDSLSYKVS